MEQKNSVALKNATLLIKTLEPFFPALYWFENEKSGFTNFFQFLQGLRPDLGKKVFKLLVCVRIYRKLSC